MKWAMNNGPQIQFDAQGSTMREIGAIAAYLIAWLFCEVVIGIKSGLTTLVFSLLFAFAIYALIAYAEHEDRGDGE